ncbi:outer membrane protein assembly factor BamD [Candidatus Fermentibacteria bacterium]|nr:outer membrane protein assembly factor BamD [Candidatus Fermentibacteria bacterium]
MTPSRIAAGLVWIALIAGCASAPKPPSKDGAEIVAWAKAMLAREHYRAVVNELERLVLNFPDQPFSDEAQFLLGEAHMGLNEYILAENAYRLLIDSYPGSQYRDDAELAIAMCYSRQTTNHRLDQSSTVLAERALVQFIEDHPGTPLIPHALQELRLVRERLARKLLEAARFYLRRGRIDSARVYLDQIEQRYPDSTAALEARYLRGRCHEKEGNLHEAAQEYVSLLDDLPQSDSLRTEVVRRLADVRGKIGA